MGIGKVSQIVSHELQSLGRITSSFFSFSFFNLMCFEEYWIQGKEIILDKWKQIKIPFIICDNNNMEWYIVSYNLNDFSMQYRWKQ